MTNTQAVMKKPFELWQGIVASCLLLITVGTIIVQQSNKIATQEEKIIYLQEKNLDIQSQFREMNSNLREMSNKLIDIRIAIENKQDRKTN